MEELGKNIYELRGVAGIIGNIDQNATSSTFFDNMMYVLSTKITEVADNIEKIDTEK